MNEKYGIELELITNKFKAKIEQVKKAFKGIGNEKVDLSKQVKIDNLKREFELASNQAEMLRHKLKTLKNELSQKQQWEIGTKSYVKLQNEIDKTSLQLEKAGVKVDNLNNKLNVLETTNIASGITKGISTLTKGLDKMTSKIKRFSLSLLSIRSIWALVSRASSAYLAQDTALADKLQSVWAGLGAMLAPIIEKVVNILAKGVAYINIFIKALTGVDLLAKASAKSMAKAAKSAKGLNKALAGFDELNNLDTEASAGTGISNPFASIKNEDLPWVDKVKEFGEWVKQNIPTVTGLLGGLAGTIVAVKTGLVEALAKTFDVSKIRVGAGIILIIYGIIKGIQDLIKYLKDPSWENFGKLIQDVGIILFGFGLLTGNIPLVIAGSIVLAAGIIAQYWEQIKQGFQKATEWIKGLGDKLWQWFFNNIDTIKLWFGGLGVFVTGIFVEAIDWITKLVAGVVEMITDVFDGVFRGVKGILDGIIQMCRGNFKQGLISVVKGIVNAVIGVLNGLISGINAIIYPIRQLIVAIGSVMGKSWNINTVKVPKIPYLDVGTNYVPEDQLAYIHKGEAVVPKKFNSQEYFGKGNDETNSLLEQVIEAINNIEVNPYTTIRDVGQTAVNYINGKTRQYGRSVI